MTELPKEVWVLRFPNGRVCKPALDDDGTNNFLAWPTREQAEKGLRFAQATYDLDEAEIVRLV